MSSWQKFNQSWGILAEECKVVCKPIPTVQSVSHLERWTKNYDKLNETMIVIEKK